MGLLGDLTEAVLWNVLKHIDKALVNAREDLKKMKAFQFQESEMQALVLSSTDEVLKQRTKEFEQFQRDGMNQPWYTDPRAIENRIARLRKRRKHVTQRLESRKLRSAVQN